jgi:hypothetical protein
MARQEDSCWQCGATWTTAATTTPSAVASDDRIVIARLDADRWADEGGSVPFEERTLATASNRS